MPLDQDCIAGIEKRPNAEEWKPLFLEALRLTGMPTIAAKAVGVSNSTPYEHRYKDPEFAAEWQEAERKGLELDTGRLEQAATKRARKKSDVLLMFMLKSRRPHVYDDRMRMLPHLAKMSDDELLLRAKGLLLEAIATKALPATIVEQKVEFDQYNNNDAETDREGEGE